MTFKIAGGLLGLLVFCGHSFTCREAKKEKRKKLEQQIHSKTKWAWPYFNSPSVLAARF